MRAFRAKQGSGLTRRDACNLVRARAGLPQRLSVPSDGVAHLLNADLTTLAKLADVLERTLAVPLAA